METAVQVEKSAATYGGLVRPQARAQCTEIRSAELMKVVVNLDNAPSLQAIEARAAALVVASLGELEQDHPDWTAAYDAVDTDTCPAQVLLDLLESAPTAFARGMIFGKLNLRMQAAAVSGREF